MNFENLIGDGLIPIVAISMPVMIVFVVFYFRNKAREDIQKTIRLSIEKGNALTPEMIDKMRSGVDTRSPERGIFTGLTLLAIGIAFVVWSYLDHGYIHGFQAGLGVMLGLLGVANLIYALIIRKRK